MTSLTRRSKPTWHYSNTLTRNWGKTRRDFNPDNCAMIKSKIQRSGNHQTTTFQTAVRWYKLIRANHLNKQTITALTWLYVGTSKSSFIAGCVSILKRSELSITSWPWESSLFSSHTSSSKSDVSSSLSGSCFVMRSFKNFFIEDLYFLQNIQRFSY